MKVSAIVGVAVIYILTALVLPLGAADTKLLLAHGARPSDQDAAGRSVKDRVTADWIDALLAGVTQ
jgi:hypothetical protein